MTKVVNIHRREAYDVYIGRPGKGQSGIFGNPYAMGHNQGRGRVLELFEAYFLDRVAKDLKFREKVLALRGKRLGCFCTPEPCHGHIIAKWIDSQ